MNRAEPSLTRRPLSIALANISPNGGRWDEPSAASTARSQGDADQTPPPPSVWPRGVDSRGKETKKTGGSGSVVCFRVNNWNFFGGAEQASHSGR